MDETTKSKIAAAMQRNLGFAGSAYVGMTSGDPEDAVWFSQICATLGKMRCLHPKIFDRVLATTQTDLVFEEALQAAIWAAIWAVVQAEIRAVV